MPTSRKKGCLLAMLVLSALLVWTVWQIGEPGRRARCVHRAIRPGMPYGDVEALLTGRYYCLFQVNTNQRWRSLSRSEFTDCIRAVSTNASPAMRLQLHFMGRSPLRVSFEVALDHAGAVTNVSDPYGWD
jgi:hypothetical protein